jgi:hypothetical protein
MTNCNVSPEVSDFRCRCQIGYTQWERTKADWRQASPVRWPTLEQWTSEVLATRSLACPGTEKARAVHALGAVEMSRLHKAVTELVEWLLSTSI